MVKLKGSLKNSELDVSVAKKRAVLRFSAASSKFHGKRQIPWQTANSMVWHNNQRWVKYNIVHVHCSS